MPREFRVQYDPKTKIGTITDYFVYSTAKEKGLKEEWRNNTYSPEILNYKQARQNAFDLFLPKFLELLLKVRKAEDIKVLYLIPVPCSNDLNYKGGDDPDHNLKFCEILTDALRKQDIPALGISALHRVHLKRKLANITPKEHAKTFQVGGRIIDTRIKRYSPESFILVDDIRTSGNTLEGSSLALKKKYRYISVIKLAVAQTKRIENMV